MDIQDFERLPDISDMSTQQEERFLAASIEDSRSCAPHKATGYCLDPKCGEQLITDEALASAEKFGLPENTPRFCDAVCRDHFELFMRMKQINGG